MRSPAFHIGRLPVYGSLVLAPMDGYTDQPFRQICREFGSAMSYCEFVNVDELTFNRRTDSHAKTKLKFAEAERPVVFQIYGSDETRLVETALRLQERGPDIIDINLGCSVHDIAERGAGAGLLRDPAKIGRVFAQISRSLKIPVTGKIRLGWDADTRNHLSVAKTLQDNGAALIAVHARTKVQAFGGQADWDAIAQVKQAVQIPVLGNGDVRTVADIDRMQAHTGCDGVMIGRAAIGHPWIFARRDREQVTVEERLALVRRHLALVTEFYGAQTGLILFRKHTVKYFLGLPHAKHLRVPLLTCTTVEEYERLLGEWEREREL